MKKRAALFLVLLVLTGCTGQSKEIERGIGLRMKLLQANGCSFDAVIHADYGDKLHTFSLHCAADAKGTVFFTVIKPDSISGITGSIDGKDGKLTYDGTLLYFPMLADEQIAPVTAPWILMKTLRSGYLSGAANSGDLLQLRIDDSYDDDALKLDIWLDNTDAPVRSEILYRGRKILSLDVSNFQIE